MKNKKNILFRFGHIYMFWSSGIFEIKQLKQDFDVTILVTRHFYEDKNFHNYLRLNKDVKVICAPCLKKFNIFSHFAYKRFIENLFKNFEYNFVIQNDYIEIENMYIFTISKKINKYIKRIVLAMSQSSSETTFVLIDQMRLKRINKIFKIKFFSKQLLKVLLLVKKFLSFFSNIAIPNLIGIRDSYLKKSAYENIDMIPVYIPFDYFVTNESFDHDYIKKLFDINNKEFAQFKGFKYLSPPIRDNYYEVNNKFDDGILFAPSLLGCRTIDEKETELIGKWISFLESVIYKAELKRVGIKFHPSIALLEKNFIEISSLIKSKLPKAEIYAPKHDVMLLINDYKYILSDVSTVLVQARYFHNKILISKDFGDFPNSSLMKFYDGINYIDPSKSEPLDTDLIANKINHKYKESLRDMLLQI